MDWSWVIGTAILWVLKLVTIPFAKLLAGDRVKKVAPVNPAPTIDAGEVANAEVNPSSSFDVEKPAEEGTVPAPTPAPAPSEDQIPTGFYILADVIIMGVAGGLLGLISGYYFIGISWKPRDWPGMIVFIGASLLGSIIHG